VNTFNLPDLRGRVPIHQGFFAGGGGGTFVIGQSAGSESITLISQQLPSHTHQLFAASSGQVQVPASNTLLASTVPSTDHVYGPATAINTQLAAGSISAAGGSQPHENRQPFLAINFIISLFGIYPSRN
jgi:microcystin-dependent protein